MPKKENGKKTEKKRENTLILAGLFIGLGLGLLYDQTAAGVLIGLGVGYLATFLMTRRK